MAKDKNTRLDGSIDDTPEWLQPEEDASLDAINELIEEEVSSAASSSNELAQAQAELAQWSSAYDDPRRELAMLQRVRQTLKAKPKNQLKPGQFAAVKARIAALEQELGL